MLKNKVQIETKLQSYACENVSKFGRRIETRVHSLLYSQTESDGSLEVTAGVSVGVVPRSQVGGDAHLDEREESHEAEDD
jgi:hypothetical protein